MAVGGVQSKNCFSAQTPALAQCRRCCACRPVGHQPECGGDTGDTGAHRTAGQATWHTCCVGPASQWTEATDCVLVRRSAAAGECAAPRAGGGAEEWVLTSATAPSSSTAVYVVPGASKPPAGYPSARSQSPTVFLRLAAGALAAAGRQRWRCRPAAVDCCCGSFVVGRNLFLQQYHFAALLPSCAAEKS